MDWARHIEQTLADHGGLATRQQLLTRVPRTVLDGYVGRQFLDRLFPRVYCRAGRRPEDRLVLRAALAHVGPVSALSHLTALHLHGVQPLTRPLHATVDHGTRRAGAPGLVVHRRLRFDVSSEQCTVRAGLPVTALHRSLVDSWPLLPPAERRPLLLDVTRRRMTTAGALREALAERPNVGGHAALARTIELIADGCQSELEVMGVLTVFRHRSLPRGVGQYRIPLPGGGAVHADRAWPEVKLAVELDGARFHTGPADRQRDLARDTALAALGWLVLRFTYADVLRDADGVRARVLAVHQVRQSQLAAG